MEERRQGNLFCAFPYLHRGWGSDRLNSACFIDATWKVPLKSWHEIHMSQSIVSCHLMELDITLGLS